MKFLFSRRRLILGIAAAGNFIGSIAAIISPAFFFSQFFRYQPDRYATFPWLAMYHYTFWAFVLIMGIAFLAGAIDPVKNRIVLMIGGFGKVVAAAFWVMLYSQGHGRWLMISGGIWDTVLGIIMLMLFFVKTEEKAS
ncbi:MAG TPA: hypothetical protein VFU15_17365 [Bacteroidia bacterium]|nr:hypothetical protein [Bacteroidia bacterium]